MDELTQIIKKNIKLKYTSVKNFADEINIPATTIASAISKGVGGTAFSTVNKICTTLDIKFLNGVYPVVNSENLQTFLEKMSKLDEKGLHSVTSILELEYLRCITEAETVAIALRNASDESKPSYPVVNVKQTPSKTEISELIKQMNDDEDALTR